MILQVMGTNDFQLNPSRFQDLFIHPLTHSFSAADSAEIHREVIQVAILEMFKGKNRIQQEAKL